MTTNERDLRADCQIQDLLWLAWKRWRPKNHGLEDHHPKSPWELAREKLRPSPQTGRKADPRPNAAEHRFALRELPALSDPAVFERVLELLGRRRRTRGTP